MLSSDEQQLFQVARRAQVNRNTAIFVFDQADVAPSVLVGTFVRVLLELPSHQEDYVIAQVDSIVAGTPYSGFSTVASKETRYYLKLQLPRPLAEINGVHYQLNSVSNRSMTESDFVRWLQAMRESGTLPSYAVLHEQLLHAAEVLRACEEARTRVGSGNNNNAQAPPPPSSSAAAAAASGGEGGGGTSAVRSVAVRQSIASAPLSRSVAPPPAATTTTYTSVVAADAAGNGNHVTTSSNTQALRNNYTPGQQQQQQSPSSLPPPFAPQLLASSSTAVSPALASATLLSGAGRGVVGGGGSNTNNNSNNSNNHLATRLFASHMTTATAAGAANDTAGVSHSNTPASVTVDAEDAEVEHRLRQQIINRYSQESVLFPHDIEHMKLTPLRLLERDMNEYLQHVHSEIASRLGNCVVCMDRVSTVIIMPCKHKVVCRFCAPAITACPVCRSLLDDIFEIEEV